MRLMNSSNANDFVVLSGAVQIVENDAVNLTVHLNEAQRVRAIQISNTPGGDGIPMLFLHGGPGAGSSPIYQKYFNPKKYHLIYHYFFSLLRT